ncbi:MAG: hypothetical protein Q8K60_08695 [Parachlamydiaceae bacterium]|nr:hypothetical protein [Parachlamydiaceae bacterium]
MFIVSRIFRIKLIQLKGFMIRNVDHAKINIYYFQKNEEEFLDDFSKRIKSVCKVCLCFREEDKARLKENLTDFVKRYRYLSLIMGKKIYEDCPLKFTCPTQSADNFIKYIDKTNKKLEKIAFDIFNETTFDWNTAADILKENGLSSNSAEKIMKNLFENSIFEKEKKQKLLEYSFVDQLIDKGSYKTIQFSKSLNNLKYNSSILMGSKCIFGTDNSKIVLFDYNTNDSVTMLYEHDDLNTYNVRVKVIENSLDANKFGYFCQSNLFVQNYTNNEKINFCMGDKKEYYSLIPITAACFIPSSEKVTSCVLAEKNIHIYKWEESKFCEADVDYKIKNASIQAMKYSDEKVYIGVKKHIIALDLNKFEGVYSRYLNDNTMIQKLAVNADYILSSSKFDSSLINKKDFTVIREFGHGSLDVHIDDDYLILAQEKRISIYDLYNLEKPLKTIPIDHDKLVGMNVSHDCLVYTGQSGKIYKMESSEIEEIEG